MLHPTSTRRTTFRFHASVVRWLVLLPVGRAAPRMLPEGASMNVDSSAMSISTGATIWMVELVTVINDLSPIATRFGWRLLGGVS